MAYFIVAGFIALGAGALSSSDSGDNGHCHPKIEPGELGLMDTETLLVLGCERTVSGRPFQVLVFTGGRFGQPCMVLKFREPSTGLQTCQRAGPPKNGDLALAGPKNERLRDSDLYELAVSERVAKLVVESRRGGRLRRQPSSLVRVPDPPPELRVATGFAIGVAEVPRGSSTVIVAAFDSRGRTLGTVRPSTRSRGFGPL